jgi:hypothetical protein
VQSISGLLAHFFYPYNLTSWEPLEVTPWFILARQAIVAGLVGMVGAMALLTGVPQSESARWRELNAVLLLSLLVAPLTWTHYYTFCLIPLAARLRATLAVEKWRIGFYCVIVALTSAPVVLVLPTQPLWRALYERVLVSHYVFGAVALLGLVVWTNKPAFSRISFRMFAVRRKGRLLT